MDRWLFEKGRRRVDLVVSGRLVLDDDAAMVEAAVRGAGVAYLANGYVAAPIENGQLSRLLLDLSLPMPTLTLYYPSRRRMRKLRVLIDFLREANGGASVAGRERRQAGRRGAGA